MTVSETLNRAADLIEERGWWNGKGDPHLRRGECAFSALGDVVGAPLCWDFFVAARDTLLGYLEIVPVENAWLLADWNDGQPDGAAVVAALRAAALIADREEVSVG